jgi:hypothetical protein
MSLKEPMTLEIAREVIALEARRDELVKKHMEHWDWQALIGRSMGYLEAMKEYEHPTKPKQEPN